MGGWGVRERECRVWVCVFVKKFTWRWGAGQRTVPSAALKSSEDLSPHISAISARSFQQENEEGPRWGPHGQGVGVPKDQWRRAADPTGAAHPSVSRDQGSRCPRTAWYLCLGSSWRHGRSPSDRRSSKTTEWVGQWRHQNIQPQPRNQQKPASQRGVMGMVNSSLRAHVQQRPRLICCVLL